MPAIYKLYEDASPCVPPRVNSAFFTGHRDYQLTGENIDILRDTVINLIDSGTDSFYAGGAVGFDTCAEILLCNIKFYRPNIKIMLALPFDGYCHRRDSVMNERFNAICRKCDAIYVLCSEYSTHSYHDRNRFMADNSSVCVSYLEHDSGGTASTVRYAENIGCRVINLFSKS